MAYVLLIVEPVGQRATRTQDEEMVGSFLLLNVATREEALAIAAECPAAQWCSVEVRAMAPCHA